MEMTRERWVGTRSHTVWCLPEKASNTQNSKADESRIATRLRYCTVLLYGILFASEIIMILTILGVCVPFSLRPESLNDHSG